MIKSPKEPDFPPREEGNSSEGKAITATKASSSSTPWLRLKDPRIVRVSRAFGGKDRHSKVCTIRGLRDRRVRLSVPTAIQLYDLQDRLGLNQPSKVVDWLLNAAKHEIDELPPLPVPPGSFSLNHQALLTPRQATASASQSNKEGFKSNESTNFWDTTSNSVWRARSKEIVRENEKENWRQRNLNEEDDHNNGDQDGQVSPNNNVLPRTNINHTFFPPSMVHNNPLGYRWESQNYPLSHLGSHGFTSQAPDHHHHHHLHNLNAVSLPSTLSLSTGSTQFLVSPPGTTTQPYFPNSQGTASMEIDPRQVNHFQMLSTSSNSQNPTLPNSLYANNQTVRFPFHFSTTSSASKLVQFSQNDSGSQQNKERE
ncbi:hypothetical protein UlMin_014579 [Ulmus minor]